MSDDKTLRNSPDSKRININEPHEVAYWTKSLGITADELTKLVSKVGTSAEAVREALKK